MHNELPLKINFTYGAVLYTSRNSPVHVFIQITVNTTPKNKKCHLRYLVCSCNIMKHAYECG